MAESNLRIWNLVKDTDQQFIREAVLPGGKAVQTVDGQYAIRKATTVFGPFGLGWGIGNECTQYKDLPGGTVLAEYRATLWYTQDNERCTVPVGSTIRVAYPVSNAIRVNDEWYKSAQTDAIKKGLTRIGFFDDVYSGTFDGERYGDKEEPTHMPPPPQHPTQNHQQYSQSAPGQVPAQPSPPDQQFHHAGQTYQQAPPQNNNQWRNMPIHFGRGKENGWTVGSIPPDQIGFYRGKVKQWQAARAQNSLSQKDAALLAAFEQRFAESDSNQAINY